MPRQQSIAQADNGYVAKMVAYKNGEPPQEGWDEMRIGAMRLTLALKMMQHAQFCWVLLDSADRTIVEVSSRDEYWGAKPRSDGFTGMNILGKLLMETRELLEEQGMENFRSAAAGYAAECLRKEFRINGAPVSVTQQRRPQANEEAKGQK